LKSLHTRPLWLFGVLVAAIPELQATAQLPVAAAPVSSRPALNVDSVIAMVRRGNPRIGAAIESFRAAQGARRTAGAWTNPKLTYQVENAGFPGQSSPSGLDRETSVFAMLPLEPAYQLRSRAARASAEVRAVAADARSTRREITLQAVATFYSTAFAQVQVAALDDNRAWIDSLVAYTGARVKEGAAAEVDLIRLEVERDRAETDLALARVDLARSHAALASLIGLDDFAIDFPSAVEAATSRSMPELQAALAAARKSRPEIAAADARVAAASSGVALERHSVVRELALMAGVKSTAGTRSMMSGVSLSLPLFDQNRGEIQRAEAQRLGAAFDRQAAEREVVADVTATVAAVETLSAQLARMQDGLIRRAEEARRVAEGAYREGATPLTQVLEAARTLAAARQLYYRALFGRDQAVIELNSSLGADQSELVDRSAR
jgi:cobalt-zinc-cadmium efflux system outer membrane protein